MPYDSIATMLLNIGMYGAGLGFAVFGLILGAVRGMTKNSEQWAIGVSAFSWLIALMIPSVPWALTIFLIGAIALTIAFMPILEKMNDTNIFVMAVIGIIINVLLVVGSGAYTASLGWQDNIGSIQTDLASLMGAELDVIDDATPDHGLCRPDDPSCETEALAGAFNPLIFDVFASILTIGDYIAKAIKFVGMVIFAPFVIGQYILPKISNAIVFYLMAFMVTLWNLAIVYKIVAFILNKRGMT